MAIAQVAPEERVVLHNVAWETYERLLADLVESSAPRLTYDQGTLEIVTPLREHEEANRTINLLVEVVAEEWGVDVLNFGSTTFRREDLARGFEPDSCFYIQNAGRVEGHAELDLTVDPAPDLVIEIDITHPSLDKLPLFARLGVLEVWRYDGREVSLFALDSGAYQAVDRSVALPHLTREALNDLVERGLSLRRTAWLRHLRAWAREQQIPG
jgi:Uma2 family endonuclease